MKAPLKIRFGPMGAEKTLWLIEQYIPGMTLAFIPALDHRSGASLKSHNGKRLDKDVIVVSQTQPERILSQLDSVKRILIDETNFFSLGLVDVVEEIRKLGVEIMASGLLLDSDLKDFGPTRKLAKIATEARPLFARCDFENSDGGKCRNQAVFNYYKGQKPGQVVVGAFDIYGAACEEHWNYFRDKYQGPMLSNKIDFNKVWQI